MSTLQIWFQVGDDKWHAAEHAFVAEGHLTAHCGYVARFGDYEAVELEPGVLPLSPPPPAEDAVCLHCQRALELERREQGEASSEGMPEAPEEEDRDAGAVGGDALMKEISTKLTNEARGPIYSWIDPREFNEGAKTQLRDARF
jgi:hypothetical protein